MADKFLKQSAGTLTEVAPITTSGGSGDAGKIFATDGTGKLDSSFLPTGVGAETAAVSASEALSAGDFVNVWSSAGAFKVRRADGSSSGKEAHGFVLASVLSGATATVYLAGINTAVTAASPGVQFLSDSTPGGFAAAAPTTSAHVVQRLGIATSATAIAFEPTEPIVLA